jgi:hypothetical protein
MRRNHKAQIMDFKSPAYAIPPPGHCPCKPIPRNPMLQDWPACRHERAFVASADPKVESLMKFGCAILHGFCEWRGLSSMRNTPRAKKGHVGIGQRERENGGSENPHRRFKIVQRLTHPASTASIIFGTIQQTTLFYWYSSRRIFLLRSTH